MSGRAGSRQNGLMSRAPLAAGAAGAALAVAAVVGTWSRAPYPLWLWAPMMAVGLSFIVSGTVLWRGRPGNHTGVLMVAAGITWYVGTLQLIDNSVAFGVGFSCFYVAHSILVHLLLALPEGRLARPAERWLVAVSYVAAVGTQAVRLVVEYPPDPQEWGDPLGEPSTWGIVGSVVVLILWVIMAFAVVRKWSRLGRPLRLIYAPVLAALSAMGVTVAVHSIAVAVNAPLTVQRLTLFTYSVWVAVVPVALAVGLLRARLARLRVAGLVVALQNSAEPDAVRAAIAEALGDPSLRLWFPLVGRPGYTDQDGFAVATVPAADRATTPVTRRDEVLAVVVHDPALAEQRPLVDAVLAAAALALDNARLLAIQRAQTEELRASRARIVAAADSERRRIHRDLHDGVQHRLMAVSMLIGRTVDDAAGHRTNDLTAAATELRDVIRDLRDLTEGIHPPILVELGLAAALESLAERACLPVRVRAPERRFTDEVERAVYFVVTEALANVYKHAAASRAEVEVSAPDGRVVVRISDDGVGGADPSRGTGLHGLRDRVTALSGELRLSSAPGAGTRIVAELPCGS
jgi:signal transduction histidine kinase